MLFSGSLGPRNEPRPCLPLHSHVCAFWHCMEGRHLLQIILPRGRHEPWSLREGRMWLCSFAIVNPRLNRCDLSHCFHIFLAGRFSIKSRSLTFPLLLLSSATGVGGMDFWSLLVLQEPLVFFPSDLFRASDLIEWLYGSLKPASQWYRAFLLTKQFCIQYLICFSP